MTRHWGAAILCAFVLAACDKGPPPPPVVVFATGEDGDALSMLLTSFTDDTGIPVSVEWGTSADNTNKLFNKSGTPADVLITDNVADVWRAADRGALRPIQSAAFGSTQPFFKDPDGTWAAFDIRFIEILHARDVQPTTNSLDDLGSAEFTGKVCVSSPNLSANRSLIAYLIEERGVKEAERLVRRWVKNLAAAPFASEVELVDAIRSGRCDYGIATGPNRYEGVTSLPTQREYIDASAVGVGRHAINPETAQKLVDWILRERGWVFEGEPEPLSVSIAGWRDEEARLLAERAGYR